MNIEIQYLFSEATIDNSNEFTMDIWSLGCIVAEMSIGEPLWNKIKRNNADSNYYFQSKKKNKKEDNNFEIIFPCYFSIKFYIV